MLSSKHTHKPCHPGNRLTNYVDGPYYHCPYVFLWYEPCFEQCPFCSQEDEDYYGDSYDLLYDDYIPENTKERGEINYSIHHIEKVKRVKKIHHDASKRPTPTDPRPIKRPARVHKKRDINM